MQKQNMNWFAIVLRVVIFFIILTDLTELSVKFCVLKFLSFGWDHDGWRNKEWQEPKLGDAQGTPKVIFKDSQATNLGDAPEGIPSFFNKYRYVFGFVSFMRYVQVLERLLHLVFTFLWCTMLVWDIPWLIYRMLIALYLYLLGMAL